MWLDSVLELDFGGSVVNRFLEEVSIFFLGECVGKVCVVSMSDTASIFSMARGGDSAGGGEGGEGGESSEEVGAASR